MFRYVRLAIGYTRQYLRNKLCKDSATETGLSREEIKRNNLSLYYLILAQIGWNLIKDDVYGGEVFDAVTQKISAGIENAKSKYHCPALSKMMTTHYQKAVKNICKEVMSDTGYPNAQQKFLARECFYFLKDGLKEQGINYDPTKVNKKLDKWCKDAYSSDFEEWNMTARLHGCPAIGLTRKPWNRIKALKEQIER